MMSQILKIAFITAFILIAIYGFVGIQIIDEFLQFVEKQRSVITKVEKEIEKINKEINDEEF